MRRCYGVTSSTLSRPSVQYDQVVWQFVGIVCPWREVLRQMMTDALNRLDETIGRMTDRNFACQAVNNILPRAGWDASIYAPVG